MNDRALPALLVVAAGLALAIGYELYAAGRAVRGLPTGPAGPDQAVPAAPVTDQAGPDQVAAWTTAILARPLFDPQRRPAFIQGAAGPDGLPGLPRLAGVIVGPSDRAAIFMLNDSTKPLAVMPGGQIGAFTVTSIEPGEVTLLGPDGRHVLQPRFDGASGAERENGRPPASRGAVRNVGQRPASLAAPAQRRTQ